VAVPRLARARHRRDRLGIQPHQIQLPHKIVNLLFTTTN
jgi:hypothetical protein